MGKSPVTCNVWFFQKKKNTNNLECNGDDLMLPSSRVDVLISKNPQNFFWKNTTDKSRQAYIKCGPLPLGSNLGSVPSPTPPLLPHKSMENMVLL